MNNIHLNQFEKISLPQNYFSKVWRAIIEFQLIEKDDHILIGFSGGKDSLFLLVLFSLLQRFSPIPFQISAFTIDTMFQKFPLDSFLDICQKLSVPFFHQSLNIKKIIKNSPHHNPCYSCAFFRHGAISKFAQQNNFNKIAYAHHKDDVVETFIMNLFYSGYLKTFLPKTFLSRSNLFLIRPLIYFREHEIIATQKKYPFQSIKNHCPYNNNTKRAETKALLKNLQKSNPMLFTSLSSAIRFNSKNELWQEAPARHELKSMFNRFFAKNALEQ